MIGVHDQPGVCRDAAHASSAEPSGLLFDIMRYALHDGPGIRTTVFFKGCPLSCWWCHNPEGQSPKPNLMFFENRCMGCGDCIQVCPHGAILRRNGVIHTTAACRVCGTCAETCPSAARKVAGRWMTVSEAMRDIERDLIFWEWANNQIMSKSS